MTPDSPPIGHLPDGSMFSPGSTSDLWHRLDTRAAAAKPAVGQRDPAKRERARAAAASLAAHPRTKIPPSPSTPAAPGKVGTTPVSARDGSLLLSPAEVSALDRVMSLPEVQLAMQRLDRQW